MSRKRYTPEQIISMLREAEVAFGRLVQPGGGHTGLRLRLSSLIGADGAGVGLDLVKRRRGRSRTGGMGERHWGFVTEPS